MQDNIEDILKQTRLTVERGEVESIVKTRKSETRKSRFWILENEF